MNSNVQLHELLGLIDKTPKSNKILKDIESFLRDSHAFTYLINNLLSGMVYICLDDIDCRLIYASKGCSKLTGYSFKELVTDNEIKYKNIILNEDNKIVRDKKQSAIKNKKKYEIKYRILTKSKKTKWVHEIGSSMGILKNGCNVLLGYIYDITNEKDTAGSLSISIKELDKINNLLMQILEKIPIGIATNKISNGERVFINKKFEDIYGWPGKEIIDVNTFFHKVYPDKLYREKIMDMVMKDMASKDDKMMHWDDIKITKKSGETAYVNALNIPVYNQDLMISTVSDTTEQHEQIERITRIFNQTIKTMSAIVESRDPYTSDHQIRVTKIAAAIAKEMNLPKEKVNLVYYSSMLHDIGKIYIPSSILSKPGKLSEIEMQMIRKHSEFGFDILKHIDFPWPIKEVILEHHERLNGSGYPRGLKNDEIMPEAKIIAVADVIEAMTSHRPYRPALGIEKAISEINDKKGTLYDAEISEIAINLIKEKRIDLENI